MWPKVKNLVTNETTTDWLDGIKNLTLEASTFNRTVPVVIQRFIDQAPTAGYDKFISLQLELITALKAIEYEYECLADKQHAITTVIKDCRLGREPFPALYQYATQKHKLNRQGCIAKGIIPYTSQEQFFTILNATAVHQDWYTNCLLNSESLIYRVCDEKVKGMYMIFYAFLYFLVNAVQKKFRAYTQGGLQQIVTPLSNRELIKGLELATK